MQRIGIIGAGAWGTALALAARRAGRDVVLWCLEEEVVRSIAEARENRLYLPGVPLDPAIRPTGVLAEAIAADAVLLVTPAQYVRAAAAGLAPHLDAGVPVLICAKGIETDSGALMTEVVGEAVPAAPLAVLSGPTFAAEVARGRPTAVTLAASDPTLCRGLTEALGTPRFRPYLSDDPVGAQVGGAVKNVIAIACGIAQGRAFGDNARAALVTRGLAEMVRLGHAKGAKTETLMGLSGLGDLALTCYGEQSRNMSLGMALGRGARLADVLAGRRSVAEGVATSVSVNRLADRLGVEMPICAAVESVLHKGAAVDEAIELLLSRPFKEEGPAPRGPHEPPAAAR